VIVWWPVLVLCVCGFFYGNCNVFCGVIFV